MFKLGLYDIFALAWGGVLEELVRVCGYFHNCCMFQNLPNKMCEVSNVSERSLLFLSNAFHANFTTNGIVLILKCNLSSINNKWKCGWYKILAHHLFSQQGQNEKRNWQAFLFSYQENSWFSKDKTCNIGNKPQMHVLNGTSKVPANIYVKTKNP